jgi:integrase
MSTRCSPLDADELKRLIKACAGTTLRDRRDEAIMRLMAETGARAGEVVAMTVDDIDVRRGWRSSAAAKADVAASSRSVRRPV